MTVVEMVPSTWEHAAELALNIRQADADEVWAAAGRKPLEAVEAIMRVSRDPMVALADGRVAAFYGVEMDHVFSPVAVPWLLSTDLMGQHWAAAARLSRKWVQYQRQRYDLLFNYVDVRHIDAIKWLIWLGFSLSEPAPYGPFKMPFRRFEIRSEGQ
jgi:hypothetical protein